MLERVAFERLGWGRLAELATFAYLSLPLFLFFAGWLKPLFAFFLILALLACAWLYGRSVLRSSPPPTIAIGKKTLWACILLIITWTLISGIGGLAPQTMDFNKHDAVTNDLVRRSWPVQYGTDQGEQPLVYYVAWYLPAAAIGKVLHSTGAAQACLLLWSIIGMLLVFYWLSRLAGKSTVLLVLLFMGFSGLDIIGSLIMETADITFPLITRGSELQWYTGIGNLQYSPNTVSLFWVPQHAIAGWMLTGMLATIFLEKRRYTNSVLLGVLGILWSPFVTIGLLPIYICMLFNTRNSWRQFISAQNILAVLFLCTTLGLFILAGHSEKIGLFWNYSYTTISHARMLVGLIVFILLEFGIYAALLYPYIKTRESREWYRLFIACTVFLTLLPLFRMGIFNDLAMRASIPSIFLFTVFAYRFIAARSLRPALQQRQLLLSIALGLGLIGPLIEFNAHLLSKKIDVNTWHTIGNPSLSEYEEDTLGQYIGTQNSFFYQHLANQ